MAERDDEIAELKARLAAMERQSPVEGAARSGTGFSRGFFGCFGVAAAIGAVVVGIAAMGMCAEEPQRSAPVLAVADYNRLTYATHCINALSAAGDQELVDPGRSALVFPWSISKVGGSDALPMLECAVQDSERVRFVTVELLCADADQSRCSRLVGVADARAVL